MRPGALLTITFINYFSKTLLSKSLPLFCDNFRKCLNFQPCENSSTVELTLLCETLNTSVRSREIRTHKSCIVYYSDVLADGKQHHLHKSNSNPSHLQPLPTPYRGPCVLGDRDQTRPMPTCTRPEALEF